MSLAHTEPKVVHLHLRRQPAKPDYGFVAYAFLHFAGFIATTILMTMGVFVLAFLAIGDFSIDGMMHHLANLSSRYIAADAGRVASFKLMIGSAGMLIALAIMFFRRGAILPPRIPASSLAGGQTHV